MPLDPIFRIPSEIAAGESVVVPRTGLNPATPRAVEIGAAGYRVKSALFDAYRARTGAEPLELPFEEQTELLMAAFCGRTRRLEGLMSPAVTSALSAFRDIIPLLPFSTLDDLQSRRPAVRPEDCRDLLSSYAKNSLPEDEIVQRATNLAFSARLMFRRENPLGEALRELEQQVAALQQQGCVLREFASGSEARVYLHSPSNAVYKALPIRGELLQIPPVLSGGDLAVSNQYGTFLADAYGGMPLFDRAALMAQVAGVCRTEFVAITSSGFAIYKQPYLGDIEPNAAEIAEWSRQFGHADLPEQNTGDGVLSDIARRPFVSAAAKPDTYIVGMDLNPRNCRVWNGACVPFDPVLRVLNREELASSPRLQLAVEQIEFNRTHTPGFTPAF